MRDKTKLTCISYLDTFCCASENFTGPVDFETTAGLAVHFLKFHKPCAKCVNDGKYHNAEYCTHSCHYDIVCLLQSMLT